MTRILASRQDHQDKPCAHASRQAERKARALQQSEAVCRANNARLTPIRRKVLEALYDNHKPLGAYELAESLEPSGRPVAPITIYRALDFLMEQGLAHKLASLNAYIPSFHLESASEITAFLICDACGGVDEITMPELSGAVTALLEKESFKPKTKLLEISGCCSHCRDGA